MDGFRQTDDGAVRVLRACRPADAWRPRSRSFRSRVQQTVLAGSGMPYREWLSARIPRISGG